jgi:catechol 2,3-dioxygenase-like lactoylglutathione lyase family enzyme
MLHVAEIETSIRFYEMLGFRTVDTEGCAPLAWARLHCEDGSAIMFLRAERTIDPSAQALILYMYTPDLAALRAQLVSDGVTVPAINYPEYMPSGKFNIADPDGYKIEIAHWGKSEQDAWENKLKMRSNNL